MRDGIEMFLPQGALATKSERSPLRVLQHVPGFSCLPREELERLDVEASDVNAHPEIVEVEPLDTAKPPAELTPRHVGAVRLGEKGTCNDAPHREVLRSGPGPVKPTLFQLQEFALALLVGRLRLDQLQEEKIEFLTKRRGRLLLCVLHGHAPGHGFSFARKGQ